jgi:hypothetical protein
MIMRSGTSAAPPRAEGLVVNQVNLAARLTFAKPRSRAGFKDGASAPRRATQQH